MQCQRIFVILRNIVTLPYMRFVPVYGPINNGWEYCFLTGLSLEYANEFLDFCPSVRWKLYFRVVFICIFLTSNFKLFIFIFISMYYQFILFAHFYWVLLLDFLIRGSSQYFSQFDICFLILYGSLCMCIAMQRFFLFIWNQIHPSFLLWKNVLSQKDLSTPPKV